MNRSELAHAVADKAELSKAAAVRAVDAVFESITGALKTGEEVRVLGFGTFTVAGRAARKGLNPQTGETIQIAAKQQARFKPGKGLREALNPVAPKRKQRAKPAATIEPAVPRHRRTA